MRGRLWQVQGARAFDRCEALHLEPIAGSGVVRRLTLFTPFDRPVVLGRPASFRAVSRASWVRSVATLLARARRADRLFAPAMARIDLLPYQLEPAIAAALDGRARLLIADAVGLGKTVEAGLVILELRLRRLAERVLVITPAGLRRQWARELGRRFRLACTVLDAVALAELRRTVPSTVNPWSVPSVAIASVDFLKRPDVERGASDVSWDLVVVDEAHLASRDTERRAVVHRLASQARHVVLLTATPHAGDDAEFASLCQLGQSSASAVRAARISASPDDGDSLAVFRRTRADVGLSTDRRIHIRAVTQTEPERRALDSLVELARAVWRERAGGGERDARLAITVLLKRALSSPASLLRSLDHRIASLEGRPPVVDAQLDLFGPDAGESDDGCLPSRVAAPGLLDTIRELEWLRRIAADARLASASPSKVAALVRVLTRVRDPAIVFTEYRDTLEDVAERVRAVAPCALLHGGLDEQARTAVLRQFARGRARVLLATDAAGEGLNLHARCRLVINLELPWNPMRLEQRIGRVDRIGQTRRVHAMHLVARDTLESVVLARLASRVERIRRTLGDFDGPLGLSADALVADGILAGTATDGLWAPARPEAGGGGSLRPRSRDLGARATAECRHAADRRSLLACRALRPSQRRGRRLSPSCPVAWIERGRVHRFALACLVRDSTGLLVVFETLVVDGAGQFVESALVPVVLRCRIAAKGSRRATLAGIERILSEARPQLEDRARTEAMARAQALATGIGQADRRRQHRLAAIAWAQAAAEAALIQPGLFDHRALRSAARARGRDWHRAMRTDAGSAAGATAGARADATGYRLAAAPVPVAVFAMIAPEGPSCSRA